MKEEKPDNPWLVQRLEEFQYFCCPECDLKDQSKENFVKHALNFHPLAHESLGNMIVESQLFEEEEGDNKYNDSHDYQNYDDNNYHNYDDNDYQTGYPGDEDGAPGNGSDEDYFDEKSYKKKRNKKKDTSKRSYVRVKEGEKVKILKYIQEDFDALYGEDKQLKINGRPTAEQASVWNRVWLLCKR